MAGASGRRWKRRTRQCVVCRKHFVPHARVSERQRTCGQTECGRVLHQRAREAWRAAHPGHERAERLRERLRKGHRGDATVTGGVDPVAQVDWGVAREVVGVDVSVIIEESLQVTSKWVREVVSAQVPEIKGGSPQVSLPVA